MDRALGAPSHKSRSKSGARTSPTPDTSTPTPVQKQHTKATKTPNRTYHCVNKCLFALVVALQVSYSKAGGPSKSERRRFALGALTHTNEPAVCFP